MNCKEIIIEKLKALGADGLCGDDCGCGIDNLFPCDSCCLDCVPAKKAVLCYEDECDGFDGFEPLSPAMKKNADPQLAIAALKSERKMLVKRLDGINDKISDLINN